MTICHSATLQAVSGVLLMSSSNDSVISKTSDIIGTGKSWSLGLQTGLSFSWSRGSSLLGFVVTLEFTLEACVALRLLSMWRGSFRLGFKVAGEVGAKACAPAKSTWGRAVYSGWGLVRLKLKHELAWKLDLFQWHALRTWPCSFNATLLPGRGRTSTGGPASNIKSQKNGAFSFAFHLDLFVLLEVPLRLMFAIRLKCEELAGLVLWLRLERESRWLACERPKTRDTLALTFDWLGWDICSYNTRTPWRSWRRCSDFWAILSDSG